MRLRLLTKLTWIGPLLLGCMYTQPQTQTLTPIGADELAEMAPVAVEVQPECLTQDELPRVAKGAEEAASSGAESAMHGYFSGAARGGPGDLLACILLAPIALPLSAAIGATVGAIRAHPTEEVEAAESAMRRALVELGMVELLQQKLVESGNKLTPARFVACSADLIGQRCGKEGPAEAGAVVTIRTLVVYFPTGARPDAPDPSPDFTIVLDSTLCVTRPPGPTELLCGLWRYKSPSMDFFDAADNDAVLFRDKLAEGISALASTAIRGAFVGGPPQPVGKTLPYHSWRVSLVRRWGSTQQAAEASAN